MSDAALVGEQTASRTAKVHPSVSDPSQQEQKHHHHHNADGKHAPVAPTIQSEAVTSTEAGQTSRITTDGNIIRSDDPTTRPDATIGEKLKGDVKGAISGSIGSLQAATGVAIRNEGLEQKGLDKMNAEDARLGTKHGVLPVGSDLRSEQLDTGAAGKK